MRESGHTHDFLQLEQAFNRLKRRMDAEWAKSKGFGLNAMQSRILIRLLEEGPQNASTLADSLSVTAGAITGMADKLMDLELLERVRDLDDRRIVYLVITEKGRELVLKLIERRTAIMEMMFSGLSGSDVQELTRLFNQIVSNMEQSAVN